MVYVAEKKLYVVLFYATDCFIYYCATSYFLSSFGMSMFAFVEVKV